MKKIILLFLLLTNMTFASDLDFKIGQMIIIGFNGNSVNSFGFKKVLKQIKNNEISGVLLFSKNIKSKEDLINMNKKLTKSASITPFVSIDNEGGIVQRYDFYKHKSAQEVSKLDEFEAKEEYKKLALAQKELGINLNFAPCVDLEINPNSIIKKKERSYGIEPETVSKYAEIFIKEHNKIKIATSIKHFPGHGSVLGDTHKGFVDATNTFQKEELVPYSNLKHYDKLNMVMVSHIFNSNIDEKFPASLSEKTIKNLLVNEIGFEGVIVSDDYDMKAIRDNYSLRDIVVNSINSGINLLIFSNNIETKDGNIAKKIKKIIKKEIELGNIKIEDIDNSYRKIIRLKRRLNS
ncbi:MAG: glycoside hydrolase family 3 protein [Candidatus Gastranaerophilales bacterium]|nr:glycoside hydrolase family 3 protein [Candidatus Gastranaerophilales bacterium]